MSATIKYDLFNDNSRDIKLFDNYSKVGGFVLLGNTIMYEDDSKNTNYEHTDDEISHQSFFGENLKRAINAISHKPAEK